MSARVCLCLLLSASIGQADDLPSFNRDVRPILTEACFTCHGPNADQRQADLRLDIEEVAKEGAIVSGDSQASELVARIRSKEPGFRMPPLDSRKSLSSEQIKLLERWIDAGAEYQRHWAYVAPRAAAAPLSNSDRARSPVDAFLLERMQASRVVPTSGAESRTLIRRLTFDLTGLPPSPSEVEAFVNDPNPAAYARLVDRLLASPAFGERMASYWLDLVRFADTVGYHGDQDHNISPYRDYVIDVFNDDLPFDQFTREQLAGDLMPKAGVAQQIASGYNRLLQTSHEGGVQPKEYLTIYAADRVRNVSSVWLAGTLGCAQCHDHKYDPYTIDDFYSMAAFFADIDEASHFKVGTNSLPTRRPPEIEVLSRWQRERIAAIEQRLSDSTLDEASVRKLTLEEESIRKSRRLTMVSRSIEPRETRILARGNWMDDSGRVVGPGVPGFLGDLGITGRRPNRLDLANWLVDLNNGVGGLTARVFANRFWYLLFGIGISSDLTDFGGQGEQPTHPELLDWLAQEFVKGGWSVKALVRRLVMSQAYRQSSRASAQHFREDPNNRLFARQTRYRLPAEMVRDNVLSISGLLVPDIGGPSVKPHQPAGYYRHLSFPRRLYIPDRGPSLYRRGVYVHWQRQYLHPMLKATDAPTREECTAQRPRSNTPLEALMMLNDPSMVDAAIALASRLCKPARHSDIERIVQGFELSVSRKPFPGELSAVLSLLAAERRHYEHNRGDAENLVDSAERSIEMGSADPVEIAAWTSVARALLNSYESVSRN